MTLEKAELRRRRNIGGDGGKQVESPEDCKDSEILYEGPRWGTSVCTQNPDDSEREPDGHHRLWRITTVNLSMNLKLL